MGTHVVTFTHEAEVNAFCNGGLRGGYGRHRFDLDGLTLTFSTPSDSVTFVGNDLTLAQVNAQLQAAIPSLKVVLIGEHLWIVETTPTNGVAFPAEAVVANREAARTILGFGNATEIEGVVIDKEGGTAPRRVSLTKRPNGDFCLQWEDA